MDLVYQDYDERIDQLLGLVNLIDDPQSLLLCEEIDAEWEQDLRILLHHAIIRLADDA